jgi:hypothetical protein
MKSYAPALLAAGLMLLARGMIGHWPAALVGALLGMLALWKWIQELEVDSDASRHHGSEGDE